MSFISSNEQQKEYVTKSKDGNYEIPVNVLSIDDANKLIGLTKIYAKGSEVCDRSVARDVATRSCWKASIAGDVSKKKQVDKILGKYLKK